MNSPFFSIIIPTYNSEATLQRTLNSILEQLYSNFEIVIVDGISKDNTIAIIQTNASKDNRIKFSSEKDNGIYDAMNKGIQNAGGEWLYFLGSNDYLANNNVLKQVAENIQNYNGHFFYGDVLLKGKKYDGEFNLEKLLQKNISHQAIFYNKVVFEKLGNYSIHYRLHADWEFNIRYFLQFESNSKYASILIAHFEEGGVSAAHDVVFLRECLLPLKLHRLQLGSRSIKNIKVFDEYWRLVRNADIRSLEQLREYAGGNKIPNALKKMVATQKLFSPAMLRKGLFSKLIMLFCYITYSFAKEE